jgi:UDP-sulfoquinovose synthase
VEIKSIPNPRKEAEEHYYNPAYQGLQELGVIPHLLTEESMSGLFEVAEKNSANIRKDVIFKGVKW